MDLTEKIEFGLQKKGDDESKNIPLLQTVYLL